MKKRTKRSIVIISLGLLGALALAMRPALCPDEVTGTSCGERLAMAPATEAALDVRFTIDLDRPQGYTRYIHAEQTDAFPLLQPVQWNLRIHTVDGGICVTGDTPVLHAQDRFSQVKSDLQTFIDYSGLEKMPDNSYHRVYNVLAVCQAAVTPSFWGQAATSTLVQSFRVDVDGGYVEPQLPRIPVECLRGRIDRTYVTTRMPVTGLPMRPCATPEERALTTVLYALGRIDSPAWAAKMARALPGFAKQELERPERTGKPWPDCWGQAAPLAKRYARSITPTLMYLQEQECFGSSALADFINSPDFAGFFGESFADKIPDPLDGPVGDYEIEKVDAARLPQE